MPDKPDLGEQALSKAAEIGLSSQLDEVEELNVDLRTDPLKMMQGELESADINGKGLVMEKDLRTEQLAVHTNNIAIDPLKAAFGEIQLTKPTDAEAHVVLTEADLQRAFNSAYIQEKLQRQPVEVNGKSLTVDTRQVQFNLPGEGKVHLTADLFIHETNETKQVSFTAIPQRAEDGHRVVLEDVEYAEGKEVSPELTKALLQSASDLLDLRNFELEGMKLRFTNLEIQTGKMTLQSQAHVTQFPGA